MLNRIKVLLKEQGMCVLATAREDKPHCSLMAYVTDEAAEWIYMVTHQSTTKYGNVMQNQQVSLLVDNRCEGLPAAHGKIQALTVHGTFQEVQDEDRRRQILEKFLLKHPHMREFATHPDAEILSVRVNDYLLLDGITDAHRIVVPPFDPSRP